MSVKELLISNIIGPANFDIATGVDRIRKLILPHNYNTIVALFTLPELMALITT